MTYSGQSPIIGLFIEPVRTELNLDRAQIALLYLVATTTSALMLPLMGRFIDRFGVQIVVSGVTTGLGFACFLFSKVRSVPMLLLAFFMLRFFGQGSLMLVSQTAINFWWVRRRGTMMGVGGAIMSLGMIGVMIPVMKALIDSIGWRKTYVVNALLCWLMMLPIGAGLFRNKPETYGLQPDGDGKGEGYFEIEDMEVEKAEERAGKDEEEETEIIWTTQQALCTWSFWSIALGTSEIAATGTAYWYHLPSVCMDAGLSIEVTTMLYPVSAVISVGVRLIGGYLIDRKEPRCLLAIGLVLHAVGLALVLFSHPISMFASIIMISAANAFMLNTAGVAYAQFFGRTHLGTIASFGNSMVVLGSAVGPYPFGLIRDKTGSFDMAFAVGACLPLLVAMIVMWKGKKPTVVQRKSACGDRSKVTYSTIVANNIGDEGVNRTVDVDER